mgnify:CR=1 FL=1
MAVETGPSAAILIDFDNICLGLANSFGALAARNFALSPQTWLSWFASGGHANDGQSRRFIVRRAYMNADSFRRSKQLQSLFASGEARTWSSEDYDDPVHALIQSKRVVIIRAPGRPRIMTTRLLCISACTGPSPRPDSKSPICSR